MKHEPGTPEQIAEAERFTAEVKAARVRTIEEMRGALRRMCSGEPFMSIPADRNRDADLILAAAIDEVESLRAERDAALARAEEAETERTAELEDCLAGAWGRAERAEAERDEWRQQHDNLLSVRDADLRALAARAERAEAALRDFTCDVCGESYDASDALGKEGK